MTVASSAPSPADGTGSPKPSLGTLLRDRRIRSLAIAELISSLGSGLVALAITYFTYHSTGSLMRTVLVTAAYTVPAVLFSVTAGRLADRHSRRSLLIVLYSLKAVVYVAMGVMSFAGVLDANWLLLTSFVAGSLGALGYPAWEEYEKDLIHPDLLGAVNALFSSMSSIATLVGAVLGGIVVATIGVTAAFVADALSYIPLLVVLTAIHPHETVKRGRAQTKVGLRDAIATIRTTPQLRRAVRNIAMLSLLAAPIVQLLPAVAAAVNDHPATLGFVTAVYALGGAAVAWVITKLRERFDRAQVVEIAFLIGSIAIAVLGAGGIAVDGGGLYVVFVATLIPFGLAMSLAQSVISAILQIHARPEVEGEIYGIFGATYSVLAPAGALLLTRLASDVDLFGVLMAVGVALIVYSAYVLVDFRRARARGEIISTPTAEHAREHATWGLGGGLFAHHHLRMPLVVCRQPSEHAKESDDVH